jgi:carbonic anhydrase
MFDDLLAANRTYAASFDLLGLPAPAAKHFGLVACMDSRIEPLTMLGLRPGDAKIMRNAGGRVTPDVLRSLVLATTFLDVTHIAVMQHTGCAMAANDEVSVRSRFTPQQKAQVEAWDFLTMADPDAVLAEDVATLRSCTLFPDGTRIEGWRYDVETGLIARVVPSED